MKKERGSLTIEATISLTLFLFCVLFFLNFARVYMLKNMVAYGAMEASKEYSLDYCTAGAITSTEVGGLIAEVVDLFSGTSSEDATNTGTRSDALTEVDVWMLDGSSSAVKLEDYFAQSITTGEGDYTSVASEKLEALGIENGLDGLDFSASALLDMSDAIVVHVNYKIKLMFPLFGLESIEMQEEATSRLWKFTKWN